MFKNGKRIICGWSIIVVLAVIIVFVIMTGKISPTLELVINLNKTQESDNKQSSVVSPLDRFTERITKKPFGIYITSATSPVQPERFSGYHTGVDFEVFEAEINSDVKVVAFCSGELRQKQWVSGYGGLVVQDCMLDNQAVTVIYGHLDISSLEKNIDDEIMAGKYLGLLGKDKSPETDGERKHLHLGIYKGESINLKGYVQSEDGLSEWLDPIIFLK